MPVNELPGLKTAMIECEIHRSVTMNLRRDRRVVSLGRKSGAFNATKHSLLSLRPPSSQPGQYTTIYEPLTEWEERLHLTRSNTRHMLEAPRRWLVIMLSRGIYYVSPRLDCLEAIEDYIRYERKNHPAKKNKGREYTSRYELDTYNNLLYPDGIKLTK